MKTALTAIAAAAGLTFTACASQPIPPAQPEEAQSVHSYILLDRTGSMSDIWTEALSSVNAYAEAVGQEEAGETDDLETTVTLAAFDFQDGFQYDVLRQGVTPDAWSNVTNDEVSPRGMTPLFDAINRTITMAEADNPEKAVIVIMTDGLENSSREVTREGAKAAMDRAKARGWEVVFLGAEFASFGDAQAVGVTSSRTMAVGKDQLYETQQRLAKKAREYGKGESEEIIFDEADRAAAGEEDVKQRKGQNRR
ncbi:MAG: vWA domain-containing protein [Henriciella sp.]|nr:vWA domain-containing protein [Henriciella sp.]